MHIQNFPKISQPLTKTQLPFNFDKNDKNDQDQDWGMNPNPDNFRPDWSLVGGCALAGAATGIGAGAIAGNLLAISPLPFALVGTLLGTYVGGNIGLALSCKH